MTERKVNGDSLTLAGLSAGYRSRTILQGVDIASIEPGVVGAVIGPNGAGKTTLLRALAGFLPAQGAAHLGECDLLSLSHARRSAHVAYMPQTLPAGVALTVLETVVAALKAAPGGFGDADALAVALDLLGRLGIAEMGMTMLNRLSGGQRQLASFAQAVVRRPKVLLLDEPTSALDLRHQVVVMQQIRDYARRSGALVLMVLHDIGLAMRWADRIILMSQGRVVVDGDGTAITPERLADVYGVSARVEPCSLGHPQVLVDGVAGTP
ncbi:MAG TPA: ABC transporter ATP-binding protein [Candidatus Sulfotelmatobacter sp.]|jgi:iron complex transport system ATP-binding protein|nr:ABC transporter ATP-binding protein [Candidatus Sulfotelmatobacter sp.]